MPGRTYNDAFELAVDQFGLVTTAQAREAGIDPQSLLMMERRGAVRRVSHGVYRLVQFPETELDPYMEAVLWPLGVRAVISHESALLLFELSDVNPAQIHVSVPEAYRTNREIPAHLNLHRQDLGVDEITLHHSIPVTTPARTIRDCHEAALGDALIRQAIDDARANGLISRSEEQALRNLEST